jgi:hypothetical protein
MHFLHATSNVLHRVAEFQYLPLVPTISKIFRHVAEFQNLPQDLPSQIVLLLPDFFLFIGGISEI